MTAPKAHPSTQSLFDYLIWVPTAFYGVLLAWGLITAPYSTNALMLTFSAAIFALVAFAHCASARRIRELDAALRHLRETLR